MSSSIGTGDSSNPEGSSISQIWRSDYYDQEGPPIFCFCKLRCPRLTSNTAKNPGRRFYECPVKDPQKKCNFHEWHDKEYPQRCIDIINRLRTVNVNTEMETLIEENRSLRAELDFANSRIGNLNREIESIIIEKRAHRAEYYTQQRKSEEIVSITKLSPSKQLPPELLTEILSRLPVKLLLRLRCLSKLFRNLIDSHDFIKYHLAKSLLNNTNLSLILTNRDDNEDVDIISFDFDLLNNPVLLKRPLKGLSSSGFCNGLLCLSNLTGTIALFNIATRKHRFLRRRKLQKFFYTQGFGYDSANDDYKVVSLRISYPESEQFSGYQFMVYSLKENVWRKVRENCHYSLFAIFGPNPVLSGKIHFLASRNPAKGEIDNKIVGFDFTTEKYNEVLMPDSLQSVPLHYLYRAVLGGCLCLVSVHGALLGEIWVMKEYGVKESWIKLFSVAPPEGGLSCLPVAYSRNRDKVLMQFPGAPLHTRLGWYDLEEKMLESVEMTYDLLPSFFYTYMNVESLEAMKEGKKQVHVKEMDEVYDLSAIFDARLRRKLEERWIG